MVYTWNSESSWMSYVTLRSLKVFTSVNIQVYAHLQVVALDTEG